MQRETKQTKIKGKKNTNSILHTRGKGRGGGGPSRGRPLGPRSLGAGGCGGWPPPSVGAPAVAVVGGFVGLGFLGDGAALAALPGAALRGGKRTRRLLGDNGMGGDGGLRAEPPGAASVEGHRTSWCCGVRGRELLWLKKPPQDHRVQR